MKKFIVFLVLLAAAYLVGYWPQRALRSQLDMAKSAVQVCRLENELMNMLDQIQNQNYGTAQQIAGTFFNDLRGQLDNPALADSRQNLNAIVNQHDAVIAAMAKADGSVAGALRADLAQIRQIQEKLAAQTNF